MLKQTDISFYIFRRITYKLGNDIIAFVCYSFRHRLFVMDVRHDATHTFRQFFRTSIEQRNLPPSLLCQCYDIGTDRTCSANK